MRCYHIRHFLLAAGTVAYKPYPARPEQSLVFYPREREVVEHLNGQQYSRPPAMVMNQYTVRTNRHTSKDFLVIIAELHPGVMHHLLRCNLSNLTNTDIDASSIIPKDAGQLSEQLANSRDYAEMIQHVDAFATKLCSTLHFYTNPVERVARYLLHHKTASRLDWLADQACLSLRQFERRFVEHMGVSPKTYLRLTRMHLTYKTKLQQPQMAWLDIALSCGYHDYQHMVRDYKQFADTTPAELFALQQVTPEYFSGLKETFE